MSALSAKSCLAAKSAAQEPAWPYRTCPVRRSGSKCFHPACCSKTRGVALPTNVCFSNRQFGVKHFQTIHHDSVDVAHGLVLLFGIGTKGPSIMEFENEAEQSFGRPCRLSDGRSKRTYELTSFIVPRGTSFHRSVGLGCSPIALGAEWFSCCYRGLFPAPAKFGAIYPYAVHDHG